MKKNAMLKIAAILMVAVLLTTCAISSTFAKYVTDGATATHVGRVAKWNVKIEASATGLFGTNYDDGEIAAGGDDVASVVTPKDNVVAPGTGNSASLATTLTGKPEVAFVLTTDATVDLGSGWMVDLDGAGAGEATFYCPLKVKVNGQATPIAMNYDYTNRLNQPAKVTTAATFAEAIELAIEAAGTREFAAGTDLTSVTVPVTVEWAWDFSTNADGDKSDTLLGDAGTATISIAVKQTATQLETYTAP